MWLKVVKYMYKLNKDEIVFFIKLANIMNESIDLNKFNKFDYKEYIHIKMNGVEEIKLNKMSYKMDSIINGYIKHKELNLWNNKLTSIPSDLSKLTELEWLNLGKNNLTSIPDLSKLTELKGLYLWDSPINLSKNKIRKKFNIVKGCGIRV